MARTVNTRQHLENKLHLWLVKFMPSSLLGCKLVRAICKSNRKKALSDGSGCAAANKAHLYL